MATDTAFVIGAPLFIANLALSADLVGTAKLGIYLASAMSAVAGFSVLASYPASR